MDDDKDLAQSLIDVLAMMGHKVKDTPDGEEAVRVYKEALESGSPFDVVILDLTVPGGMGGKEAARLIRQCHKEARICVSTGYSNEMLLSEYREYGFDGVLMKPYKVEDLRNCLRKVSMGSRLAH